MHETNGVNGKEKAEGYPCEPQDINLGDDPNSPICGFFGKYEIESAAGRLVAFFQHIGQWRSFGLAELLEFYRSKEWDPKMMLYGLHGDWWDDGDWAVKPSYCYLIDFGSGMKVTHEFVQQCVAEPNLAEAIARRSPLSQQSSRA